MAALDLAEYGYLMESGRVFLDGAGEQLKGNEDVKEFYLAFGALGGGKAIGKQSTISEGRDIWDDSWNA